MRSSFFTTLAATLLIASSGACGADNVTSPEHTKKMERLLKDPGVPVERPYYATEGHGFHAEKRSNEYYTRLLDFLSLHIGGGKAAGAAS